jgi:hypothetical protein
LGAFGFAVAIACAGVFGKRTAKSISLRVGIILLLVFAAYLSTSRTTPFVLITLIAASGVIGLRLNSKLVMLLCMAVVAILSLPPIYLSLGGLFLGLDNSIINYLMFEMLSDDFGTIEQIQSSFRSYEAVQAWSLFETYSTMQQVIGKGFGQSINLGVSVSLGVSDQTQEIVSAVPITHISAMTVLVKCGWLGFFLFLYAPIAATHGHNPNSHQAIKTLNLSANLVLAYVILTFQGYFSNLELLNVPVALAALTYHFLSLTRTSW